MMNYLQKQKRSKKGFTLMEMLIVIAIIAILIAIAIPIFSAQLNDAKTRVDEANMRSAQSMAYADYLLNTPSATLPLTYYAVVDANENMKVTTTKPTLGANEIGYTVTIASTGTSAVKDITS